MSIDRSRVPAIADYLTNELNLVLAGRGKWRTTSCPFHGGKATMRVNTQSNGWCCMSCDAHGGDAVAMHMQLHDLAFREACESLDCWTNDGKQQTRTKSLPIGARDALEIMQFEALFVATCACNLAAGAILTAQDKARLIQAAGRLSSITEERTT